MSWRGATGKNGPPGYCPRCSSMVVVWDQNTDISVCAVCGWRSIPKTNADHIRYMTDEELAEWICNGVSSDGCDYCEYNDGYCGGALCRGKDDAEIIADWLKQPYKEDT